MAGGAPPPSPKAVGGKRTASSSGAAAPLVRTGSNSSPNSACRLPGDTLPGTTEMNDMVNFLRVDAGESAETMRLFAEELLLCPSTHASNQCIHSGARLVFSDRLRVVAVPDPWCEFYEGLYGGMFFHNKVTKFTSWHHPLEAHFTVTCQRLKRLNGLAKKLRSVPDGDGEA